MKISKRLRRLRKKQTKRVKVHHTVKKSRQRRGRSGGFGDYYDNEDLDICPNVIYPSDQDNDKERQRRILNTPLNDKGTLAENLRQLNDEMAILRSQIQSQCELPKRGGQSRKLKSRRRKLQKRAGNLLRNLTHMFMYMVAIWFIFQLSVGSFEIQCPHEMWLEIINFIPVMTGGIYTFGCYPEFSNIDGQIVRHKDLTDMSENARQAFNWIKNSKYAKPSLDSYNHPYGSEPYCQDLQERNQQFNAIISFCLIFLGLVNTAFVAKDVINQTNLFSYMTDLVNKFRTSQIGLPQLQMGISGQPLSELLSLPTLNVSTAWEWLMSHFQRNQQMTGSPDPIPTAFAFQNTTHTVPTNTTKPPDITRNIYGNINMGPAIVSATGSISSVWNSNINTNCPYCFIINKILNRLATSHDEKTECPNRNAVCELLKLKQNKKMVNDYLEDDANPKQTEIINIMAACENQVFEV